MMRKRSRLSAGLWAFVATACMVGFSTTVVAQATRRGSMIMDDGRQVHALHYAETNFPFAIRPDYVQTDVPHFVSRLSLNLGQRDILVEMINTYLDDLHSAVAAIRPEEAAKMKQEDRAANDVVAPSTARGPEAADESEDGGAGPLGEGVNPIRDILLDELRQEGIVAETFDDLPFNPPNVGIGVSISDDGSGPQPDINVSLSFDQEDDRLTEELREKLQRAADRAIPRISEHVKKDVLQKLEQQLLGGGGDPSAEIARRWEELEKERSDYAAILAAKRALRAKFESEIQLILDAAQQEQWPLFVRAFTRLKTLPLGVMDGEQVDLLAFLDASGDLTSEPLSSLRTEYEQRLHDALVVRNELIETVDAQIDRALYAGDTREAISLAERLNRARLAIRDLNDEFVERFSAAMPPDGVADFRALFQESASPRVFRATVGSEAFNRVQSLDNLTTEQIAAIAGLEQTYIEEMNAVNDAIYRRIRLIQSDELVSEIKRAAAVIGGASPTDFDNPRRELADAFQRRQNLDARYMRGLHGLLTPEQAAHLPRVPETDIATPVRAIDRTSGGSGN